MSYIIASIIGLSSGWFLGKMKDRETAWNIQASILLIGLFFMIGLGLVALIIVFNEFF